MEKIINYENLRSFAYVSDKICAKPIKGIVVDLFGLGDMTMFWEDPDIAEECAKVKNHNHYALSGQKGGTPNDRHHQ